MSELKFLSESESPNVMADWAVRGGAALVFVIFGSEKFSSDPSSHWVRLFHEIGTGDWFRYAAGMVEVLGGLLALIPRTATIGLTLLSLTMMAAVLIVAFVLGHPAQSVFPGVLFLAVSGIIWSRRNRRRKPS